MGNSQQQGIYQPNRCWAHPSCCQHQGGETVPALCDQAVLWEMLGKLQVGRKAKGWNPPGTAGSSPMGKWAELGGATCRLHHAGLWALPLRAGVIGEHKQSPLTLLTYREHLGEQKLPVRGKAAPQPCQPCMRHGAHPKSSCCCKRCNLPASDSSHRPYRDALFESGEGVKTCRDFCKLGMELGMDLPTNRRRGLGLP